MTKRIVHIKPEDEPWHCPVCKTRYVVPSLASACAKKHKREEADE